VTDSRLQGSYTGTFLCTAAKDGGCVVNWNTSFAAKDVAAATAAMAGFDALIGGMYAAFAEKIKAGTA